MAGVFRLNSALPRQKRAVAPQPALLSPQQARKTYRHLGLALSLVSCYEAVATRKMIAVAGFDEAESVYEFGCGTGHFARLLLSNHLPLTARYKAVDITPKMVELTRQRLSGFVGTGRHGNGRRVEVEQSDGGPPEGELPASYDRFVSNFVLDILPEPAIAVVLAAAHKMLLTNGLLCLTTLCAGNRRTSQLAMHCWQTIYSIRPELLGGCRPLELATLLPASQWQIVHQETVQPFAIPLGIVVARKIDP